MFISTDRCILFQYKKLAGECSEDNLKNFLCLTRTMPNTTVSQTFDHNMIFTIVRANVSTYRQCLENTDLKNIRNIEVCL